MEKRLIKAIFALIVTLAAVTAANGQTNKLNGQLIPGGTPIQGEITFGIDSNGTGSGKVNVYKDGGGGIAPTVTDLVIPRSNTYKMAEQRSAGWATATVIAQAPGLVALTYRKVDEYGIVSNPINVPLRPDGTAQISVQFNCLVGYEFTARYNIPVIVGPTGPQGPVGPQGLSGPPGIGIQGPVGPQGPAGKNACSTAVIKDYDQAPMGLRTNVQATVNLDCKSYTLYYFANLNIPSLPGSDGKPHGLAVLIDLATGMGQIDYPFVPHAAMMPETTFDKVVWVPGTTSFEWWKDGLSWGVKWDTSKKVYQIPGFVVFP